MTHTIKKRFAMVLLCALSITLASPVEAATIKETARKKLNKAYEKFEKQWKKVKPCITKGKCSKKQLAAFVGAAMVILGLVYGGRLARGYVSPSEKQLATYNVAESLQLLRSPQEKELPETVRSTIVGARTNIRFNKLNEKDYENLEKLSPQDLITLTLMVWNIVMKDETIPGQTSETRETSLKIMSSFNLVKSFLDLFGHIHDKEKIPSVRTKLGELAADKK